MTRQGGRARQGRLELSMSQGDLDLGWGSDIRTLWPQILIFLNIRNFQRVDGTRPMKECL
jgi:hypothetical protein